MDMDIYGSEAREGDTQYEAAPGVFLTFRDVESRPVPGVGGYKLVGVEVVE